MSEVFQYRKSPAEGWKDFPRPFEIRVKPDPYAVFKNALARGERVDMRMKKTGHGPGCGWNELAPGHGVWSDDFEYRIAQMHQDERDAYDRGEQIQMYLDGGLPQWIDVTPQWAENRSYRVKPKSKTETFQVFGLHQRSNLPFDGVHLRAAPFKIPTVALDIEHADGEVINVTLKGWHK